MKTAIDTLKAEMSETEIAAMIRRMAGNLGEDISLMTDAQIVSSTRRLIQSGQADRARSQR